MRRANDRPTTIYWLIDVRPETQQATRSAGFPFYCGKTVSLKPRLSAHLRDAKQFPKRLISQWINRCGGHLEMRVVDTVQVDGDWCAVEKRWIEVLRYSFPGGANITRGGQGAPGMIHSAEMRAKISAVHKGKIVSESTRERIGAASKGRKHPPESVERRSAKTRGTKRPHYGRAKSQPTSAEIARLGDCDAYQLIEKRRAKLFARRQATTSITC